MRFCRGRGTEPSFPAIGRREGAHSALHKGARLPPFPQRLPSNPPTWCREGAHSAPPRPA
ncbi:hypothetical protein HMPREF0262_03726 [Clostridium sp. ATCC 29733]|nr:hypothetical protein HMPREF0262_03726 [Clostridium sp. ATCC 29733]